VANFLDTLYARQQQMRDRELANDRQAMQALPSAAANIVVANELAGHERAKTMGQLGMSPDYEMSPAMNEWLQIGAEMQAAEAEKARAAMEQEELLRRISAAADVESAVRPANIYSRGRLLQEQLKQTGATSRKELEGTDRFQLQERRGEQRLDEIREMGKWGVARARTAGQSRPSSGVPVHLREAHGLGDLAGDLGDRLKSLENNITTLMDSAKQSEVQMFNVRLQIVQRAQAEKILTGKLSPETGALLKQVMDEGWENVVLPKAPAAAPGRAAPGSASSAPSQADADRAALDELLGD